MTPTWLAEPNPLLRTKADLAAAVAVVAAFAPDAGPQAEARARILDFSAANDDALHRSNTRGHLTSSCWVVDHRGEQALVLFHAKVQRWLQPGGHVDGNANLAASTLREATEETGIVGLQVWPEPIDTDVHVFVNRRNQEPDHLHLDVRFLVRAPKDAVVRGNHESTALRWVSEAELADAELGLDASTRRLGRCGFEVARRLGIVGA